MGIGMNKQTTINQESVDTFRVLPGVSCHSENTQYEGEIIAALGGGPLTEGGVQIAVGGTEYEVAATLARLIKRGLVVWCWATP